MLFDEIKAFLREETLEHLKHTKSPLAVTRVKLKAFSNPHRPYSLSYGGLHQSSLAFGDRECERVKVAGGQEREVNCFR